MHSGRSRHLVIPSSASHRVAGVVASSERERKTAIALLAALCASIALHATSLVTVTLLPGASALGGTPVHGGIDLDLDASSDVDVRPQGADAPEPAGGRAAAPPVAAPPPAPPEADEPPAIPLPIPPLAMPEPSVSARPSATATASTVPPPATSSGPVPAPSVSAVPHASASSGGTGDAPVGSASGAGTGSVPSDAPPGFSANTPAVTARLVVHFVRENAEGADWGALAAGSEASMRATLEVDASGRTTCTAGEGSPPHLAKALSNACFRLRQEKVALDVKRWAPGVVHVRVTASVSDVPVPEDRPDGIFGLEMRFADGKGHGAFTQTHGRHVDVLIEVERIDDAAP